MFQSHLDEHPIMTSPSALGQEPAQGEAGSRDVTIPQATPNLAAYKPIITIVIIAVATYMVMKAMKKNKTAPAITG
jgi:hypothetical protein